MRCKNWQARNGNVRQTDASFVHRERGYTVVAILLALSVGPASAWGAITVAGPTNHTHSVSLTGFAAGQGGTSTLNPDPVVYLAPPGAGSNFMNTFTADVGQYPGWTAVQGAALGGTLQINDYLATAPAAKAGGARMNATYTPAGGENAANLRWVQMFNSSQSGMHIDPFPNDNEGAPGAAGDLPFYYTEAEHVTHGLTFDDNPQIGPTLPVPFSYTVRFELYLVSADFANSKVTVHDGIRWGYDVVTVPEPMTAGLMLVAVVSCLLLRRRR